MLTIAWDDSDEDQRKAARLIFDQLRNAKCVIRRLPDQVEICCFDEAVEGSFAASPAPAPCKPVALPPRSQPARRAFNTTRMNLDTLDLNTAGGTTEVAIPAIFGTCYWAILRYMFLNPDRPVGAKELCEGVREIMTDRDPFKWSRFETKTSGSADSNAGVSERSHEDWRDRLVRNARNLCRLGGIGAYGQRLIEMGRVLRYETIEGQTFFTLSTTLTAEKLAPRKRGRKSKRRSES
jgi:hypothetical protein